MISTLWPILGEGAVALVAPGSPVDAGSLEAATAAIERSGREAVVPGDVIAATSPSERAAALVAALEDPAIAAVVSLRGGWGTAQLLPVVADFPFADHAKPVLGYSDLTSLQLLLARRGIVSFHGPMPAEPGPTRPDASAFAAILDGLAVPPPWRRELPTGSRVLREGKAAGRLLGGNLTTLCHLVGTPYLPPTRGAILFLEEVREAPYRIARMLTHLAQAGILKGLAGLLVGDLGIDSGPMEPLLLGQVSGPVVTGLPIGHLGGQWTLPVGSRATIDTGDGLSFRGRI